MLLIELENQARMADGLLVQTLTSRPGAPAVVKVAGNLRLGATALLREEVAELLARGCRGVALDLGHVRHIDPVGLGLLGVLCAAGSNGAPAARIIRMPRLRELWVLLGLARLG